MDDISSRKRKVPILDWKLKFANMQQKYVALDKNYKKTKEGWYKLRDERNELRDKVKTLQELILKAEQEHCIQIFGADPQEAETAQLSHSELRSPNPTREEESVTSDGLSGEVQEPLPADVSNLPAATRTAAKGNPLPKDPEGRSDNDLPNLPVNDEREVVVKEEPSSDGPAFVSERCTNKRKRAEEETGTPAARVKTEGGGSSPEMSLHRCDFDLHESIDLGQAQSTIWTPRKQRQKELDASHRMRPSVEGDDGAAAGWPGYAHAGDSKPAKFPVNSTSGTDTSLRTRVEAEPPAISSPVLTPVNANRRLPPHAATMYPADKPLREGLNAGIQDLAEDGSVTRWDGNQGQLPRSATKGRLDALLNSPSLASDPTPIQRRPRPQHDAPTTPSTDLGVPKPRALPFDSISRTLGRSSGLQTPQSRTPLADATNTFPIVKDSAGKRRKSASPKKTRGELLRNKPVAQLRAEDFKVNPQANKGHDYAFSEVVRDKEERAALPGCVDEHCCGPHFKALAESEYPNDPHRGEWRQSEQRLLEEYLGDYAYRLNGMSHQKRKDTWIEARMQQLANKHGKHKHHTSRMRSPPGFWQFDFPSTQEIEAEREEAARREKKKIQERRREAMKPGGRWLFRDE